MQLVVISGLSGSGKSVTLRALEDASFYCVDNLPATLLGETIDFLRQAGYERVAVTVDARSGAALAELPGSIRALKAQPGRDLLLQGSGNLLRWLLERDLVDELHLPIYPVIVGDGLRLFPERGPTHALELVESRATPGGVTIQTYRPNGRATFGTIGD